MKREEIKWKGMILGENGWKLEEKWGNNGGYSYGGLERENGGRERDCHEEDEAWGKMRGHRGQRPRPWAIASYHGPSRSPRSDHGVCWPLFFYFSGLAPHGRNSRYPLRVLNILFHSFCFHFLFFSFFYPLLLTNYKIVKVKARERKKGKELGLPPKKRSFKVKSLTLLLCLFRISKCINVHLIP